MRGKDHDVYRLVVITRLHSEKFLRLNFQFENGQFRRQSLNLYLEKYYLYLQKNPGNHPSHNFYTIDEILAVNVGGLAVKVWLKLTGLSLPVISFVYVLRPNYDSYLSLFGFKAKF